MTMYVAIAREREDWAQTYEFERDEPSLVQAAVVMLADLPPDWVLVSVQEAEYAAQTEKGLESE